MESKRREIICRQTKSPSNYFCQAKITFPELIPEVIQFMESLFSVSEISEVFSSIQSGKPPGPDGQSGEYYREFKKILRFEFLFLYNSLQQEDPFAQS